MGRLYSGGVAMPAATADVVANGVEIEVGQMSDTHQVALRGRSSEKRYTVNIG